MFELIIYIFLQNDNNNDGSSQKPTAVQGVGGSKLKVLN